VNDPAGDVLDNEIYNLTNLEDENRGVPTRAIYNLGSSDLPRFSCANHKLSCAINTALVKQGVCLNICKTLSSANAELRNSIKANHVFRNLKCRTRIYQKTRWCGAILLLFSNKRAYDNGAYDGEISCPKALVQIETYIQILMPAYYATLGWEKNRSSIADVIPQVLFLIDFWTKFVTDDKEAQELCFFLIHFVKVKFKYEIESEIYQVIIKN